MKYLPKINIKFSNVLDRDAFIKSQITNATETSAIRWCRASQAQYDSMSLGLAKNQTYPCTVDKTITSTDPLNLTFVDVVAMDPTPYYYNVALDPPVTQVPNSNPNATQVQAQAEGPRILRALSLGYGLVNLAQQHDGSSVNQFNTYVATIQNGAITFSLPMQAEFSASVDDSLWMLRKMTALSRSDFADIVKYSYFPDQVSQVILEKLLARRNSLLDTFSAKTLGRDPGLSPAAITPAPNLNLTLAPHVKNGQVLCLTHSCESDFPDYASYFSFTDPASPLKGLGWYLLSDLESNAMSNLMDKVNTEIPALNAQQAYENHANSLFQQAVQNYFNTGEFTTATFGAWVAPVASGSVSINRSVVLGNYMGTSGSNLVQLADTFSFTGNIGMIVGFDGLPNFAQLQGEVLGSATISLSHLKPLGSLKQSVTEPLQNEFVPWLYEHAGHILKLTSKEPQAGPSVTPSEAAADLTKEMDTLKKYMGVGESLILTESISGTESIAASVQAPVPASPSVTADFSANQFVVARVHLFRADDKTVIVYKDNGDLIGIDLNLSVGIGTSSADFPLLTLDVQANEGKAAVEVFNVSIDTSSTNPNVKSNVYASAAALAQALHTGSLELLESLVKPVEINTSFKTKSSTFNFFHYVHRSIKGSGNVTVKTQDGTTGNYLALNDGVQSGVNYQSLAQTSLTFLVQQLSKSGQYSVNTQASSNPGQTFLGHSQTRELNFEAQLSPALTTPYVGVQYRWEGFNKTQADMQKLVDTLSSKYGFTLYSPDFLKDTTDVKLYELSLNIAVYSKGLQTLAAMTSDAEKALDKQYGELHNCDKYPDDLQDMAGGDEDICNNMQKFESDLSDYRKAKDPTKQGQVMLQMVNDLEKFTTFSDFVQLIGGAKNLFLSAELTGFREGSEELSAPIYSNTFGTVDPINRSGIIDSVQSILGIDSGEFDMEWIRSFL